VREICDKYDVVLIFDEIQTGMGRTGTMWACEAEDVVPDILIYGKAFGGGVMPITGIIARPHLWTEDIKENPWILDHQLLAETRLACSAALAPSSLCWKLTCRVR
jgi:putrescine aminotransferase